ncbi:PAS domain-containing protein [Sphingomonas solaris]|nr:PAS domain-containing protein [Sphingomonas solaris]
MNDITRPQGITDGHSIERALAESEERFRQLAAAVDQVFHIADPAAGRLLYVSPAYERIWGCSPAPLFQDLSSFLDAVHPDDRTRVEVEQAQPLTADGTDIEYRIVRPDGTIRWIRDRVFPVDAGGDTPGRFAGIAEDVTERHDADARLRESEARFEAITNSIDQMIWSTRPDGYHDYYNERWYEFTGVPHDSTDGDAWNGMFHPDDRERAWATWRRSLATAEPYHIEYRLRHSSGEYRWVLGRAQCMRDVDGRITRWFGTCTDIQEIVEARELLARSRAELEAEVVQRTRERNRAWEMSSDLFAIMGLDGTLKVINPAWTTTLGFDEATLLGRPFPEQVHPDDHDAVRAAVERLRRGESIARFEDRLRHADGSWRWITWSLVPEGAIFYAVGRDVTDEKRRTAELDAAQEALRQAQKMEAMGQLTGGVAHDFNNLLTPIVGALDLLQRKGVGGEREQRLIRGAVQSAERAKTLVQRLLAFARRQPLQPVAVDIAKLVTGMADLVASTTGPQIKVAVDVEEELPAAKADPNQLEMALLNLAVNARDAMPDGGTLRISASKEDVPEGSASRVNPGRYVRLSVADTGSGMDKATIARATEPFFSTKGIGKGTGLGLSMVHGLASQLGGALTISSRPGLGTNVQLWLVQAVETTKLPSVQEPAPLATGHGIALLVDDEELVRQSTADMLADLGYQTIEAASAEEALRLLDKGSYFDFLITDHLMPGMTGVDLARAMRQQRPGMPVLLVSGYAADDGIAPDLPRLTKPFRKDELWASLSDALKWSSV